MSKIIPVHVISSNNQSIDDIWGLNSNRIFDEIKYLGDNKTSIRYRIDLTKERKENLIILGHPKDLYQSVDVITNPSSTTLPLVGGSNVSISVENVMYCFPDSKNFNYSYVYVFVNRVKELYHVNQSFFSLLETLNTQSTTNSITRYTDSEAIAACKLNGTLCYSIPGISFIPAQTNIYTVTYDANGGVTAGGNGIAFVCPVNLPNGVTVTAVAVYGNAGATAETWTLKRVALSDTTSGTMATANIDTEDTTISNAVVDNSSYAYYIVTSTLDTNDAIYNARISYTL